MPKSYLDPNNRKRWVVDEAEGGFLCRNVSDHEKFKAGSDKELAYVKGRKVFVRDSTLAQRFDRGLIIKE